nr:hypothetical protein [Tanacetum cinerariifolium]
MYKEYLIEFWYSPKALENSKVSFSIPTSGTNPHVLSNQTQSVSEGLKTIHTQPTTRKRTSFIARQVEEEESSRTIKLEDLAKLVSNVQTSFKDLDSPEDDHVIFVNDSDEDEEDEVHTTTNAETKDTLWELPAEFLSLPVQVALVQAKLITLDALPSLLLNVTKALNMFAQVLDSASSKAGDQSVPSVGQSDTIPAERKKNTNQATIS